MFAFKTSSLVLAGLEKLKTYRPNLDPQIKIKLDEIESLLKKNYCKLIQDHISHWREGVSASDKRNENQNNEEFKKVSGEEIADTIAVGLSLKISVTKIEALLDSRLANTAFINDILTNLKTEGLADDVKVKVEFLRQFLQIKLEELEKSKKESEVLQETKQQTAKQGKGKVQNLLKNLAEKNVESVPQILVKKIVNNLCKMIPGDITLEALICRHLVKAQFDGNLTEDHIRFLLQKDFWLNNIELRRKIAETMFPDDKLREEKEKADAQRNEAIKTRMDKIPLLLEKVLNNNEFYSQNIREVIKEIVGVFELGVTADQIKPLFKDQLYNKNFINKLIEKLNCEKQGL